MNNAEKESSSEYKKLEDRLAMLEQEYKALQQMVKEKSGKTVIQNVLPFIVFISSILILILYMKKWIVE